MPAKPFAQHRRHHAVASLCAAVLALAAATAPAAAAGRHAALIVDANTGRVVSETAADDPRHPASLTKMMTIYIAFDLIEQGKLTYNTRITFSDQATRVQPTKLGVPEGGSITVLEAIKSLITKSANDASVALAEHIAGTEPKFAALMTQTARRIGMKSTTFKNAHGLPDSEQITTARDMITLGLRLQDDFPKHYPLFATREFSYRGDSHRNHNTLLFSYEGTDGIKTGYIGSSGFNLVANVRRDNKHVIGVVFGGASAAARNQTMRTLLNIAMVRASTTKTRQSVPMARAKPVPSPAAVARPAAPPQPAPPVAAAPPVAPVATITAAVAPQPRIIERPRPAATVTEAPAPAAAPTPEIQVARVRPLLVAPSQPKQAALPPPAPSAPPVQIASATPPPQASAPQPPQPSPATLAPGRGAPPSTFQQQAQNLARGNDALSQPAAQTPPVAQPAPRQQFAAAAMGGTPVSRLNGPSAAAPAAAAGNTHIQVGAYATKADADRQLEQLKQQAPQLLGPHQAAAIPANAGGKAVYRARFIGLDTTTAGNLCNELRRRQIDCMVAKAE